MLKGQLTLLVAIYMSISLSAQDNLSQYFDDGGISTANNALKIDLFATAGGDLTFLYERFFTNKLSLEVGVGFALGKGVEPLFIYFDTEELLTERGGGFKFLVNPRYHPWGGRREDFVFGINFFIRNLSDVKYSDLTLDRTDTFIGFYQGYLWELGNRMSLELGYQLGLLLIEENIEIPYLQKSAMNLGFSFKLSYHK